ncbi:hypothetical protein GCM10027418_14010 [Mariniluteicoccus endophyticus]
MTTVTADDRLAPPADGAPRLSVAASRARRLLVAGLVGAHVGALTCVGIFALTDGLRGAVSGALAGAMVILFYTVGQLVQVWFADAHPRELMKVTMASYVARVTFLGGVLFAYFRFGDEAQRLLAAPVVVTAIVTVVTWLAAEAYAYLQLRIPNFDEPDHGFVTRGRSK